MATFDPDALIDAAGVAPMLGLSHRNSVATYRRRYPDFPRPVTGVNERPQRWRAGDILSWQDRSAIRISEGARNTANRDMLVSAAVRLMTDQPMATISIRDIAREAGISHADIYRYVDSKEQLHQLAVARASQEFAALIPASLGDLAAGFESLLAELYGLRGVVRLLALEVLTNPDAMVEWPLSLDAMRAVIAADGSQSVSREAAALATFLAALPLGWIIMEQRFRKAVDLPDGLPVEQMAAAMRAILTDPARPEGQQNSLSQRRTL